MSKSTQLLKKFVKNIVLYGLLFIGLSIAVDWYRKPTAPEALLGQVLTDTQQQPKIIAQLSHEKPLVLYFWGSWCSFCKFTSPAIQQLTDDGVQVLSIALKSGSEADVNQYLQEHNYTFDTINDPNGQFSKQWDIQATPTVIIVKNGKIQLHTTGLTSYWGLKARLLLAQ